MLNQALNEIQIALETLNQIVHSEQSEQELSENLYIVKTNVAKTITILQKVESSLASDKVKVVASSSEISKSHNHYYQEDWQKTA